MEKVIVFGGAGFLGSHVADCLSERGYEVTIFDIHSSPYLLPGQKMILGSILDPKSVAEAIKGHDCVYNFAGIADLDDATTKPMDTVQLNIVGNINIMEAAVHERIKRYVYASSIYVYSQKGGFYRCSKQASELYIEEYQRKYGLEFTILRYGTLYGPRADMRNSIFRYLKQAVENGRIVCNGNGEEQRDYINVCDAACISVDILKAEYANQHAIITGHHPMQVKEMLLMVKEILGQDITIEFSGQKSKDHYTYTPYSFTPKIGYKIMSPHYMDMGQGMLSCLCEMYGDDLSQWFSDKE